MVSLQAPLAPAAALRALAAGLQQLLVVVLQGKGKAAGGAPTSPDGLQAQPHGPVAGSAYHHVCAGVVDTRAPALLHLCPEGSEAEVRMPLTATALWQCLLAAPGTHTAGGTAAAADADDDARLQAAGQAGSNVAAPAALGPGRAACDVGAVAGSTLHRLATAQRLILQLQPRLPACESAPACAGPAAAAATGPPTSYGHDPHPQPPNNELDLDCLASQQRQQQQQQAPPAAGAGGGAAQACGHDAWGAAVWGAGGPYALVVYVGAPAAARPWLQAALEAVADAVEVGAVGVGGHVSDCWPSFRRKI